MRKDTERASVGMFYITLFKHYELEGDQGFSDIIYSKQISTPNDRFPLYRISVSPVHTFLKESLPDAHHCKSIMLARPRRSTITPFTT